MAKVVVAAINAKWIHASLGARYLLANIGELRGEAVLVESTLQERATDLAERILAHRPSVVGLGVYVWNARECEALVDTLRRVAPEVRVVLGGPEVSHETDQQRVAQLADVVIQGEGELEFARVCAELLAGRRLAERVIAARPPDLELVRFPYAEYDERDLRDRVVYVEASRGCPFECEFCLSALDEKVRPFPLAPFLAELERLLARGLRRFKFVDRTFNLSPRASAAILEFFLARLEPGLFLHFEMIPDRLPESLRGLLARFPAGSVQLEVGVQTFDEAVAERISRFQDAAKVESNLRFLREHTGVHVHADLIAGLPGEGLASFGRGFDRLLALGPQEIQVELLKRLRGAPIARHDREFGMVYAAEPPYEVLATSALGFGELQAVRRFARVWDLAGNSGNFVLTAPLLWRDGSPFRAVLAFANALHERLGSVHAVALDTLAFELLSHLERSGVARSEAGAALLADYERVRPGHWPEFLREFAGPSRRRTKSSSARRRGDERQARHRA